MVSGKEYEDCLSAASFGGSIMPIMEAVADAAKKGRSELDNEEALDSTMTSLFQDACISIAKFVQGNKHLQFLRDGLKVFEINRTIGGLSTTFKVASRFQDGHQVNRLTQP